MDFLTQLAQSGLLGLLLALAIVGIIYIFRMLILEKDKRLQDAREYNNAVIEPLKNIQRTLDAVTIILQNAGKNK